MALKANKQTILKQTNDFNKQNREVKYTESPLTHAGLLRK